MLNKSYKHKLLAMEKKHKWNCPINLPEVLLILLLHLADLVQVQVPSNRSILIIRFSKRHLTHYINAKTYTIQTNASSPLMIVISTTWLEVTFKAPLCTNSTFWGPMHELKYVLSSPNTTERICLSSGKCLKPIHIRHATMKTSTRTLQTHKRWRSFRQSSSIRVLCRVKLTSARV